MKGKKSRKLQLQLSLTIHKYSFDFCLYSNEPTSFEDTHVREIEQSSVDRIKLQTKYRKKNSSNCLKVMQLDASEFSGVSITQKAHLTGTRQG